MSATGLDVFEKTLQSNEYLARRDRRDSGS
jgi:hypothetical protein